MKLTEKKLRQILREEIETSLERPGPYEATYSVLTVRFAPGSEPLALHIPYRPWENRADVTVPFRVVNESEPA